MAVSYTHLDVYKRQMLHNAKLFLKTTTFLVKFENEVSAPLQVTKVYESTSSHRGSTRKKHKIPVLTKGVYSNRCLPLSVKFRHYCTEALYASWRIEKVWPWNWKPSEKDSEEILDPDQRNGYYRRRLNSEHVAKIVDKIRYRRIPFDGHMSRMNIDKLANQIFSYFISKKF